MVDEAQLIAQFSQGYLAARQSLAAGDRRNALAAYQQLLGIYRQMEASGMEVLHREFAHDQLTQIYGLFSNKPAVASQVPAVQQPASQPSAQQTQTPASQAPVSQVNERPAMPSWMSSPSQEVPPAFAMPVSSGVSGSAGAAQQNTPAAKSVRSSQPLLGGFSRNELLLMSALVLVICIVVFVEPEIIGLATYDNPSITVPVDTTFKTGGPLTLTLAEHPASLRLSGHMTGAGRAKVWLVLPAGRRLLFDSGLQDLQVDGESRRIDAACLDTCTLDGVSRDITLEVELDNAELTIDSVTYTRRSSTNSPPVLIGTSDSVGIVAGQPTTVDLAQFFRDPDGDAMIFIAGETPGVNVEVTGSMLTVTSDVRGTSSIPVIASDGQDVGRLQLRLLIR